MKDVFTTYKLIILYLLDKVGLAVPQSILENYIIERNYTNYFYLKQALAELSDTALILEKPTHDTAYYNLTDSGKEAVRLFQNELAVGIRKDVKDYLKENQFEIIEEVSVLADYNRIRQNEYVATCSITENGNALIQLQLSAPTEKQAKTICRNWKAKSSGIYEGLLTSLLESPKRTAE